MKNIMFIFSMVAILAVGCSERIENINHNAEPQSSKSFASTARSYELTEEELVGLLVNDEDFIKLGDTLIDFFIEMPNRNEFMTNYNQEHFQNILIENNGVEVGLDYFTELSGYTQNEYNNFASYIDSEMISLYEKYPQLMFDETNQVFIDTVIQEAVNEIVATGKGKTRDIAACRECVRIHKPKMIASIVYGAVGGGILGAVGSKWGPFAAWANTVWSFANAGWDAQECLENAGC